MKVKIQVETGTIIRFVAVAVGAVISLLLISKLRSPLILLLISGFLALALNPPVSKISSLLPHHSRIWATAISYVLVIGIISGFLIIIIPPAVKQSVTLAQQIPSYIDVFEDKQGPAQEFITQYGLEPQIDSAITNAKNQANTLAQDIGSTFLSSVSALFTGLISVLTVLVITFLLLIEGRAG